MFSFWEESRFANYLLLNNGGKLMRAADYVTSRDNDHDAAAEIVENFLL